MSISAGRALGTIIGKCKELQEIWKEERDLVAEIQCFPRHRIDKAISLTMRKGRSPGRRTCFRDPSHGHGRRRRQGWCHGPGREQHVLHVLHVPGLIGSLSSSSKTSKNHRSRQRPPIPPKGNRYVEKAVFEAVSNKQICLNIVQFVFLFFAKELNKQSLRAKSVPIPECESNCGRCDVVKDASLRSLGGLMR